MPAGSPIGSGQGILNPNNLRIILEYLKEGDPDYPVIIDAGVGHGQRCFGLPLSWVPTACYSTRPSRTARDPIRMSIAMKHAAIAGREAYLAGRIPKRLYATASSPEEGVISSRPYTSDRDSKDRVEKDQPPKPNAK